MKETVTASGLQAYSYLLTLHYFGWKVEKRKKYIRARKVMENEVRTGNMCITPHRSSLTLFSSTYFKRFTMATTDASETMLLTTCFLNRSY